MQGLTEVPPTQAHIDLLYLTSAIHILVSRLFSASSRMSVLLLILIYVLDIRRLKVQSTALRYQLLCSILKLQKCTGICMLIVW